MNYKEALSFIHGIERFGIKPGLRRIKMLLELMGNPQDKLRFIHVAGTSGKGSVCTMLSYILKEAGYRTGLYISPFVIEFRERIQVDNEMIPHDALVECVEYAKPFWEELNAKGETPTEFEFVVAIAFEYFLRQRCDIVVLEVGMGGRFDSTNVISNSLVSVITSIGIDHTKYLGNTISEIAFEKCGIIKRGGVTVSYPGQPEEALAVIMERCAEEGNRLLIPANVEMLAVNEDGSDIVYDGSEIHIPLVGKHQIFNAMTAFETIRALEMTSIEVKRGHVVRGMEKTRFASRFEKIGHDPLVILDGAHNQAKAKALGKTLELLGDRRIHAVIAIMADKDVESCLPEILQHCATVTVTTIPEFPRAMSACELYGRASAIHRDVSEEETPEEAFRVALAKCEGDDVILICGSFFLTSELRPYALEYAAKCK